MVPQGRVQSFNIASKKVTLQEVVFSYAGRRPEDTEGFLAYTIGCEEDDPDCYE